MTAEGCPFCEVSASRVFHAGTHILALWDAFPVSPGHALIIPKRHVASWFDASAEERRELIAAVDLVRARLIEEHHPIGFNVGWNDGSAAGQTVFHLHLHVIPRYFGDVSDPRGGIRHVIPAKARYWATAAPEVEHPALVRGGSDPLLPYLQEQLERARGVDMAVAFVMRSGLELLLPHLEDLLRQGGRARILTGDYLDATDPDALQLLLDLSVLLDLEDRLEVRVHETEPEGSFHPKAYLFHDDSGPAAAYVGSSNLSGTALRHGIEWNYRIIPARDLQGLSEVSDAFETMFRGPRTRALTQEWLDAYRSRRPSAKPIQEVVLEAPLPPVEPHAIQLAALRALESTRLDGNAAGLVVLATGLGKTWLSAFDSNRPEFPRVLFVAHRDEILSQALATFRRIRPIAHLGKYTGVEKVPDADVLFASIQTLGRRAHLQNFPRDRFDYIVVDEFHHAAAATYRRLIEHFVPKFLLGLTATPERTDGGDLLALCRQNLVFRRDLFEGIREGKLCPFRYFGVPDDVDYQQIPWRSSRFDEEALTEAVATRVRAQNALEQWRRYGGKGSRTLGFCCSLRHADFMAQFFKEQDVRAVAVHSGPASAPRAASLADLEAGALDVVFTVDMLNEGVDLPHVDTIFMLRPTESRILWLQQFGRGLRTQDGKDHLTVVDYIGNHKVFLAKPQALFGLGSDRQELARLLDRYLRRELELPPGCEVTYDLQAVRILREQIGPTTSSPEALRTFYLDFKDRHGRRPTATEAFQERYLPRSARPAHGSWLGFVEDLGDLAGDAQRARSAAGQFLATLESTPMTRSYKMLVLQALLNRDALPGSLGIADLTAEFALVAGRSRRTRHDVSVDLSDSVALQRLLEGNPIAAWSRGDGTGGTSYFAYEGGRFALTLPIPEELRSAFQELVREIVDWRLAEYLDRNAATVLPEGFPCNVTHAGANPILMLPDRDTRPDIPDGWTPVRFDGEAYEAHFDKIALNVVRKEGAERNVLPEILDDWFGPDAGKPGTRFRVVFERSAEGWEARPEDSTSPGVGLEVGRSYPREQVAKALGAAYRRNWQSGVVLTGDKLLLFVTLDKATVSGGYAYKDHFLSRDRFQWQSQNRTSQRGKDGVRIRNHRADGIEVHLFVRKVAKHNGTTMPFFYCGQLEFVDWEHERPITVRWMLHNPLSDALWDHFGGGELREDL